MNEIGKRLKDLEASDAIDLKALFDNPKFIDTVLQVTSFALKTSEQTKILAFQNAIINTAAGDTPDLTVSLVQIS